MVIMIRFLFLTLILFSSVVIAQTQQSATAFKFDEFNSRVECDVNVRLRILQNELEKNSNNSAVIITYESIQTKGKIKPMQNAVYREMKFLKFDEKRVNLIDGGYRKEIVAELWIVPKDVESPKPTNSFIKFDEFGNVSEKVWKAKLDKLFEKWLQNRDDQIYIVMFGPNKVIDKLAKNYLNYFIVSGRDCFSPPRISISFWGNQKVLKTIIWIVPPTAQPPSPNSQN